MQRATRRQFIKLAGAGAIAGSLSSKSGFCSPAVCSLQQAPTKGCLGKIRLGLASYTLRKFGLDEALGMTRRVGLKYIALKSVHLPLDSSGEQIKSVVGKVRQAGLVLYGGGVIYMNNPEEVHRAFDYARAAGMKVIITMPQERLLELVDRKAGEYDIKVAIHNHGPGDKLYPSPASVYGKVKNLDSRIGLCMDVGHTVRAGADPVEAAEKFADRLHDVHIKDISPADAKGRDVQLGRGVVDIPGLLAALVRTRYAGVVAFEYEKDPDDPLVGLAESVGYVRGVLAAKGKE